MAKDDIADIRDKCLKNEIPHTWVSEKKICVKNIETINIFLQKPLVGSLAIALIAYFFAAFLYKIKGVPLEKSNKHNIGLGKYIKCGNINVDKLLFTKSPQLGMVQDEAYKPGKKNKYGKIFWPWLSEYLYPPKPNKGGGGGGAQKGGDGEGGEGGKKGGGKLDSMYVWMVPFYLTLKWTTTLYYSAFCAIKNTFYKADHWGSLSEINKINKKLWLSDLFVIFLCIPMFVFMVMPILFVIVLMLAMVVAPIRAFIWNINPKNGVREPAGDELIWGWLPPGIARFMLLFWWLILYIFSSALFCMIIFVLHILWFVTILVGKQEQEQDGLKTIIKTWANIIWDYKFIWAILAVMLWLNNFKNYLRGPAAKDLGVNKKEGILSFIKDDNQEMIIGVVAGAILILLLLQQSKYYSSLSNTTPEKRDCGECGAPSGDGDDGKDNKTKCMNPDYDPKSTKMGKLKAAIGNKVRKTFNAEKSDSRMKEENSKLEMAKEKKKLNST
jgi:hypothetical protein